MGLDQLTKLVTTYVGKWECHKIGWGAAGSGEGREVLGFSCIYLGTVVGAGSRNPPPIVPNAPWWTSTVWGRVNNL